jgi:23S rRNA (adenine2030-N6)-methyltransferase
MNYQHIYHAGNFADVFKHCILCLCLEKFHQKETSFIAIDTHAGSGKYFLQDSKITKTKEFEDGIKKILSQKNFQEILPQSFLKILAKINICEIDELPDKIKYYSGSPTIIKNFLRTNDKAIFSEIEHRTFYELKRNFSGNKKIITTQESGINLLKSRLPPIEKRGLILIDPSFEKNHNKISDDYFLTIESLQNAHKRFAHGIYLLWHPIIEGEEKMLKNFYDQVKQLKFNKTIHIKLDIGKNNTDTKMSSCGIFICNPSWQVEEKINLFMPKILDCLKKSSKGFYEIKKIT